MTNNNSLTAETFVFARVSNGFLRNSSRLHKTSACATFNYNIPGFAEMLILLVFLTFLKDIWLIIINYN